MKTKKPFVFVSSSQIFRYEPIRPGQKAKSEAVLEGGELCRHFSTGALEKAVKANRNVWVITGLIEIHAHPELCEWWTKLVPEGQVVLTCPALPHEAAFSEWDSLLNQGWQRIFNGLQMAIPEECFYKGQLNRRSLINHLVSLGVASWFTYQPPELR